MKVPIKRYVRDETLPIEEQYRQLEAHHEEETTFLVPRAFDDDELGIIMPALASWTQILAKPTHAKEAGLVPPCFRAKPGSEEATAALLRRVQKLFMT